MKIVLYGAELPKDGPVAIIISPDGSAYASTIHSGVLSKDLYDCKAVQLPKKHKDLVERKDLSNFPDYREVRNGLNRILKQTKRDNRVIVGMPIELLQQAVVALDSLRSVQRYFKEAKTIIEAEGVNLNDQR